MSQEINANSQPQRRKRTYIDNRLQGDLLRRMGVHWGALMFTSTCFLAIWIRMFEQPESPWMTVFGECFYRYLPFFIVSMILVPCFIIDSVKLTNRFAGPLYRLASALELASRDQPTTALQFRKGDFLHDIAEDLNNLLQKRAAEKNAETPEVAEKDPSA